MAERTLIAKICKDEGNPETVLVASPVVGIADGAPQVGLFLNPFDRIITMKILNQRYVLRLPRSVHGRVTEAFIPNGCTPVGYGESIARLDARASAAPVAGASSEKRAAGPSGTVEETSLVTVAAPSDGIFYRRPSPDSPAYVEVGAVVTTGSILGLVEIMKCFHQITYGGLDAPQKGEVTKILAEDASEVRFGQSLFHIKPVG